MTSGAGVQGVADVFYNVADMKRAVAFYRDVLGIRVMDESPYWTSLDLGGVRFGLHWAEGKKIPYVPRDEHGPHAGACLTLRVEDVRATVQHLEAKGVRVLGDVTDNPWGSLATFEDPDGNVLKLMQPPRASRGFGQPMSSALGGGAAAAAASVATGSRACFKCGGSGKLHWSSMSHSKGCIFCKDCDGCDSSGVIPAGVSQCPKCQGQGRVHDSSMSHSPDCIFCKTCKTCHGRGHI